MRKRIDHSPGKEGGGFFFLTSDKAVFGLFFLALLVRLLYIIELSGTPGFEFPIIDSATYCEIARNVQGNGILDPRLFWQGFFYPIYLSGIFALGDSSIMVARIFQVLIGSFSCVLVFITARDLFDRRTALIASVITALYGPLIFFESELLAAGWAAFMMILFLYMMVRCDKGANPGVFLLSGIIGGIAVLVRPTFLPAVIFSILWTFWRLRSMPFEKGRRIVRIISMAGGFIAILITVSILSYNTTGHFSPLPRSGSLNMYIGNNEHTDKTMMIRPGAEWRNLIREPEKHGYYDDTGYREYFMNRFKVYVATRPGSFLKGLFGKSLQLISSRELPRNVDVYSGREESLLMRVLVWKSGGFGFPFGLLLPSAAIGFIFCMKKKPVHLWSIPLLYSVSIILVFVSSRYRVALIPLLAIAASSGILYIHDRLKKGSVRDKVFILAVFSVVLLASIIPGPFVVEGFDYTAEKYASTGYEMSKAGLLEDAESQIRKSLELQPRYAAGQRMLGNVLNQAGRPAEAAEHFRIALEEKPDSYMTHFYLSLALVRQGLYREAEKHLLQARVGAVDSGDEASLRQIDRVSAMITRERDDD